MVGKRIPHGYKPAYTHDVIKCDIYFPTNVFNDLIDQFKHTPTNVSFSAFIVAKVEAGMEVSK